MGRTIARHFFHPYESNPNEIKEKINLKNWKDTNSPFYYDQIPIYMNKIYRSIDIDLENECNSIIPSKQCLPEIAVSDMFLEELKEHIINSPLYESVEYKIKYNDELPDLINLLKSHKYFMYYLHIPKEDDGKWFCEGRFFTWEEIVNTGDQGIYKKIDEFVKNKNIDYMKFLEEWVGLIFHLSAEFLLFKKKVKVIFYSCEKCYRPALFIKEEIINEENDENKIWGTVNIVDTIIYNCTKENFSSICKIRKRSKNNIIYHDESFNKRPKEVNKDCEIFKNETDGAFILTTNEKVWDNLIKEFKGKETNYKFDLIITGSTAKKILKKIHQLKGEDFIDRICIYTLSVEKYLPLINELNYFKIEGVYKKRKDIINFINSNEQNSEIYSTVPLYTYENYITKYMVLHKTISNYYGKNDQDCYKRAISYIKDFLLWYPKLLLKRGKILLDDKKSEKNEIKIENKNNEQKKVKDNRLKIEIMLETLQKFKGINDNEEEIIKIYTEESSSYYKDFNYWLMNSNSLAIEKTAWFISAVIYSLNKYGEKNKKSVKKNITLYRGIKSNLSDLLSYERSKGELICFPSFTSASPDINIAKKFSKIKEPSNQYATIISINYIFKKGFKPTAVDVSDVSQFKNEKEVLFYPYSFFKIKNVKIDHSKKTADIELESVGRKAILEKNLKEGFQLIYNEEGFMEIAKQQI